MEHAIPSRFRHPLSDPDPVLVASYERLFAEPVGALLPAQIDALARGLSRSDPLADAWLEERGDRALFERGLRHGSAAIQDQAPATLRALLEQMETTPLWVDCDKLRLGARVYRRVGVLGNIVLSDLGLMGGYRSAAVAKTLVGTGQLSQDAPARLVATGRFVSSVSEPDAMLRGGTGYVGAGHVRLVHALVRRAFLAADWNVARWGIPLNQADMLGTNLLFSTGFLEGCKQWGLRFTRDEEEAVVHLWRYAGYLLGIDESLLPSDAASARRVLYTIGVSQPSPDADSRALAQALYEVPRYFARNSVAKTLAGVEMAVRLGMTRRILGDESVDQLGLPPSHLKPVLPALIGAVRSIDRARTLVPFGSEVAYRVGDYFLRTGQTLVEQLLARDRASAA